MPTFLLAVLLLLQAVPFYADELSLGTAGTPSAPVDADRAKKDPFVALTLGQRKEIVREFKGLLSMAMQSATAARWGGRDIADCQDRASSSDSYCRKCNVQMGNSHADYFFYSSDSACRLQDVDITVDTADAVLLKELKPVAKGYVGYEGQFYLDENERSGQSNLRFIWKRHKA